MTVSMQQSMEKFAFSHHQQKMQELLVDKYDETNKEKVIQMKKSQMKKIKLYMFILLICLVAGLSACAENLPDIPTEYRTADEWKKANVLSPHGVNKQLDSYDESRPAAKCLNGVFVGNMENDVAVWKGIPYAKIPTGDLRFKRAQDPDNSDAIFDATYFGDSCLQPLSEEERSSIYGQSEDCLRLNVWNSSALTNKNKPVFVYIHGGGWASGGSSEPQYNGYYLAHYNPDILVVTLSYRFNLMGLINLSSFPDGAEYETSVNNGVYDLIQALKWINQNISAFGGNPENITICGESAGGGAVSVLCVNEEARQYFQKAIPMSGSVSQPNTMDVTDKLPEALKADFGVQTVADLQQIPFETLQTWWSENQNEVYHLCVRDGKAISEDPFADWTNGVTKNLILLQGHTANEYQYYQHIFNDDADFFNAICSTTLEMHLESGSKEFLAVFEEYKQALLDLGYPEDSIAREYCNDRSLAIGNTYQATKHAENGGKGYFYIFEQPYDGSMAQYGAAHAIDCYYLFGTFEGNEAAGTKEEVDLSRKFQRMIANFCVSGDPSTKDLEWPVYTAEDRCTMMIGQNMRVEKDPEAARVEAALKMVDIHTDFRYLKSFSSVFPVVQERYPAIFEAYIMNAANAQ